MKIRSFIVDGRDMMLLDKRFTETEISDFAPPEIGQDEQGAYETPYFQIDFIDKSRLLITGSNIILWFEGNPDELEPGRQDVVSDKHRIKLLRKPQL